MEFTTTHLTHTNSPEFYTALADLRARTEQPKMTGWNPHFRSAFAPVGEVLKIAREAMGTEWVLDICPTPLEDQIEYSYKDKEGASTQSTIWVMETRLVWCKTGEYITVRLPFTVNGDQTKQGATMSYNMRRAIMMLFVMEAEGDDDGASTMTQRPAAQQRPEPRPEPQKQVEKTADKGPNATMFWAARKQTNFDFNKAKEIASGPGTWEEKIAKLQKTEVQS